MHCLRTYLFATCVPGARGDEKRALDPLDLGFQAAVSHCGAGDAILTLHKSNTGSKFSGRDFESYATAIDPPAVWLLTVHPELCRKRLGFS